MRKQKQNNKKNTITANTKVYGIIGSPVKFSLSPIIHNTIAEELGKDTIYTAFPVSEEDIKYAILGGHALNIQGFNVTKPYKQAVIPYLEYIDPLAEKIGAVNTLKYEKNGYHGYNTDASGLYSSLVENNVELANENIIILGAGGAARAVAMLVADKGAKSITILNRSLDNAKTLEKEVKKHYNISIEAETLDNWDIAYNNSICFQTTSLGMGILKDELPITDNSFYGKIKVAVDLIYNPAETLFLKKAKAKGAYTINGFGMLFYQAIKAHEIWTNSSLDKKQIDILYRDIKNKV